MIVQTNSETVQEIKKIIEQNPEEPKFVRIYLAGMACSGPAFGLTLDEKRDDDETFEFEDQEFIMQKDVQKLFGDMIVEFVGGGYKVVPVNQLPNQCDSCSYCG